MFCLLSGPESNVRPGDAQGTNTAVSGISTKLVVKASGGSTVITESQDAVDVDSVALDVGIVDGVDGDALADVGNVSGQSSASLDAVETATGVDSQDEVRAGVSVEGLLDGDAAAAYGVDLEGSGELVDAGGVVVGVTALSSEMAVGASGAAGAAVGVCGDSKGAAADAAAGTSLRLEAGAGRDPGAALEGSGSPGSGGSRKGGEKSLDKHIEGDERLCQWDLRLEVVCEREWKQDS